MSMGKAQKIVTGIAWAAVMVVSVGIVGMAMLVRASREPQLPVMWDAPEFGLLDQNGKTVTTSDLRGRSWIAAFIFTRCAGPCPMMSEKMKELQATIRSPNVKLVSFTVDPERDTPEVLKEYAKDLGADESRWLFLTGSTSQIFDVAAGMKVAATQATEDQPILHDTRFLLIDPAGRVRGVYSYDDPAEMKRLPTDAAALAGEGAD
jgi:cytochrome oxidase Cu insertion factor (SCO1/SenC/PrrC family)